MDNKFINAMMLLALLAFPFVFIFQPLFQEFDLYNLYFVFLAPFLLVNVMLQLLFLKSINLYSKHLFKYYLLLFLLILLNFNMQELNFSIYLIFTFFLILLLSLLKIEVNISRFYIYVRGIIIFYFFISIFLVFIPQYSISFNDEFRYVGLWLSPTVCGISSLIYYITFLRFTSSKDVFARVLLYLFLMILLTLTKSRMNLFLGILIPFYFYFISKEKLLLHKNKLFSLLILVAIFFYPIYNFSKISSFETRKNADDSDNTRIYYSIKVLDEFKASSFISKMLGHNSNTSLSLIGDDSIKPHNDFLRIVYDYGVIFFLLYVFILHHYFHSSTYMSFIIVIYIFSFYHNMVFDFFILVYLIFMHSILKFEQKYSKL